jgi:hypothetical protein
VSVTAAQVSEMLEAASPLGGTPTSAALNYLLSLPARAVDTFVVLATDGAPNCNSTNPNHQCAGPNSSCRCTTNSCATNLCSLGCLDDLGVVTASHAVAARGMRLLVLGVGRELATAEAIAPFAAMEIALPRTCSDDLGCVSGCDGGVCGERLYLAARSTEFEAPASRLNAAVRRAGRCNWWLPHEAAASDLRVVLGAELTTEWRLEAIGDGHRVELTGAACDQLMLDTTLTPDIRWLPGAS